MKSIFISELIMIGNLWMFLTNMIYVLRVLTGHQRLIELLLVL